MRLVRYNVAASLDGYIASPSGAYDWIPSDPSHDFGASFKTIDTVLMGRRTYEVVRQAPPGSLPGRRAYVFSRTLRAEDCPGVTVVAGEAAATVAALRAEAGKDIWLMGGGELSRSLLEAGQVDTVEVGVIPVLLGGGIPFLPSPARPVRLELTRSEGLPSGIIILYYAVRREAS